MTSSAASAVLLTSLKLYGPVALCGWLLFELLRRRWPGVFGSDAFKDQDKGFFAWVPRLWHLDDDQIIAQSGMDAWVILRFARMSLRVAAVCVLASVVLCPLYADAEANTLEVEDTATTVDIIDRISIANVVGWRLSVAVLAAYVISAYVMWLVMEEYRAYRTQRHAFLARKEPAQYSIVVSDLPHALRRPQTLMAYMDYLFPDSVYSAYIGVECRPLEDLFDQRRIVLSHLDAAKAEAASIKPSKSWGLCRRSGTGDVQYYSEQLDQINDAILTERKETLKKQFGSPQDSTQDLQYGSFLKNHGISWSTIRQELAKPVVYAGSKKSNESTPLLQKTGTKSPAGRTTEVIYDPEVVRSCAFVSFRSIRSVQSAQQLLQTENPTEMHILPAPHIRDILWENFGLPYATKRQWALFASLCTFVIVLFWTIPTAFVSSLASAEGLRTTFPSVDRYFTAHPWVQKALEQAAPLVLSLMNTLAKTIFKLLATREGHLSITEVDASLFSKLCYFQFFQMFFVATVTGSIVTQLLAIVNQPKSVFNFLGSSIASQYMLFITYMIVQICVDLTLLLLRVAPVIQDLLHRLLAPTYAQLPSRHPWMGLDPLNYNADNDTAFLLAKLYLVFLVVIVFAPIAPLVGLVGAIYFLAADVIYRHYFMVVAQSKWAISNSSGVFWPPLFNFIIGALLVAQCTLFGLLTLKSAGSFTILFSIALPCCTWLFYWKMINLYDFPAASLHLPLDKCCEIDEERRDESFTFLDGVYQQPAMIQAYSVDTLSSSSAATVGAHVDSTGGRDLQV